MQQRKGQRGHACKRDNMQGLCSSPPQSGGGRGRESKEMREGAGQLACYAGNS